MPIEKCPKCGKEYDSLYSIHACEKEKAEKKEKEKQKWESAPSLRRVFMYHPDAPYSVRVIALIWFLSIGGGLLIPGGIALLIYEVLLKRETKSLPLYISVIVLGIIVLFLSYGLSHLKRWSLYLFGILVLLAFAVIRTIPFGLTGLIGLILVLRDYSKFH